MESGICLVKHMELGIKPQQPVVNPEFRNRNVAFLSYKLAQAQWFMLPTLRTLHHRLYGRRSG